MMDELYLLNTIIDGGVVMCWCWLTIVGTTLFYVSLFVIRVCVVVSCGGVCVVDVCGIIVCVCVCDL